MINARAARANQIPQTRRRIAIENTELSRKVIRFLALAHRRRAACLAALDKDGALALPNFAENPFTDLAQFEGRLRSYAAELDKAVDVEARRDLLPI